LKLKKKWDILWYLLYLFYKYIKYNKIKIEKPVHNNKYESAWGKLWQYMMHTSESKICLKIIKYIRKNKDRIRLIGVDNDKILNKLCQRSVLWVCRR